MLSFISQTGYSIRNNSAADQQRMIGIIVSAMRAKSDYMVELSSYVPLQKYLRGRRLLPFTLTSITNSETGCKLSLRALTDKARPVTIIHRYRCPGPMAEIMVAAKRLKPHQHMDLWLFGEKIDPQAIASSLGQRGFLVEQPVLLLGVFYKGTISKKEANNAA